MLRCFAAMCIALKLANLVTWPWWLVLSPMAIYVGVMLYLIDKRDEVINRFSNIIK